MSKQSARTARKQRGSLFSMQSDSLICSEGVLHLMQRCVEEGRLPRWQLAYLEDRIAMQEGRPQRYGTQCLDDPLDVRTRPWKLAEPDRVDELRAAAGLDPMHSIPERGPELPLEQQEAIRGNQRWWEDWLASKGWRP
jgi:hypothetical protein